MYEKLLDIDWFANVGLSMADENVEVTRVSSWTEACKSCVAEWETVVTESSNDLTAYLHKKDKSAYQDWNRIVEETKLQLRDPWARMRERVLMLLLPIDVAYCVEWDTLHAFAEAHYQYLDPPIFFGKLLEIYELGHFPCGWEGIRPEGRLIVY
ncbi:MAG: hypothetical protein ACK56W_11725 [Pirellula sp.]|jgi:hypothetical protein